MSFQPKAEKKGDGSFSIRMRMREAEGYRLETGRGLGGSCGGKERLKGAGWKGFRR